MTAINDQQTFRVPANVGADRIRAPFDKCVLNVSLPNSAATIESEPRIKAKALFQFPQGFKGRDPVFRCSSRSLRPTVTAAPQPHGSPTTPASSILRQITFQTVLSINGAN